jgi:hypothetical protein
MTLWILRCPLVRDELEDLEDLEREDLDVDDLMAMASPSGELGQPPL